MKKFLAVLIALVALAGFINCVLIEPALHYQEGSSISETDKAHGCMICQSVHHQWVAPEAAAFVSQTTPQGMRLPLSVDLDKDLFGSSIFHPPHTV